MTTDHANPLDSLPSLPSGMDFGAAGLWAASVLMNEAANRGWDRNELRRCMMWLTVVPTAEHATDDEFHADLQTTLDTLRARRAPKH